VPDFVERKRLILKLGGSLPVIPTPFYNGKIDFDSLLKLFEHLFPELDGCTLCGSTGEAVSLSLDERLELMKFAARNTPAGKAIVVGLTHTLYWKEMGGSIGPVCRGVGTPRRPGSLPLLFPQFVPDGFEVFPCPRRHFQSATAVKMTDHDLDNITALKKSLNVTVFSRDDVVAFRSLLLGVDGSIIMAPAVFPAASVYVCNCELIFDNQPLGFLSFSIGPVCY